MFRLTPMPSPNNTNFEKIYIIRGRRKHAGTRRATPHSAHLPDIAYDSRSGLAHDDEYPRAHKLLEGGINTLVEWCAENLSRKDIEKLIGELETVLSNRVEQTIASDAKRRDGRSADPAIREITDAAFDAFRGANAENPPRRRVNTTAMRKAADDLARSSAISRLFAYCRPKLPTVGRVGAAACKARARQWMISLPCSLTFPRTAFYSDLKPMKHEAAMGTMKEPKRTPAREALAEAIDEMRELEAQVEQADRARSATWAAITRAEEALEEFRREQRFVAPKGEHLIAGLTRGDEGSVAEIVRADDGEARERELQKNIDTWIAARDEIRTQITELNRRKERVEPKIKDRARAVVCENGVLEQLRDGLDEMQEEVARRRQALHFVANCFPPGDRANIPGFLYESGRALTENQYNAEWESAFKVLCEHPDAPLPI